MELGKNVVELKLFKLEDWKCVEKWTSNQSELIQFAGSIFSFPIDQKQVENYLSDSNRIVFRVETKNGHTVGMAEISLEANNIAKLARILIGEKAMRGKGIGTELIKKLTQYAFSVLKANKVILNVYKWNKGAIKCYQKVGFSHTDAPIAYVRVGNDEWETLQMELQRDNFVF